MVQSTIQHERYSQCCKIILALIYKHFPRHHRYHKLFHRNNVKTNYSRMSNMVAIISSHNARVLAPVPDNAPCTSNCRQPGKCTLSGNCLTHRVKATVPVPRKSDKHYYGLTEGPFKTRFSVHTHLFRTEIFRRETELSEYSWEVKDNNQPYEINWSIAQRAAAYKCGTQRCDICLTEKTVIAAADPSSTLNKRAEIVSTCRHRAKFRYDRVSGAPTWWASLLGLMWEASRHITLSCLWIMVTPTQLC